MNGGRAGEAPGAGPASKEERFRRSHRLRHRQEYDRAFAAGARITSRLLTLLAVENQLGHARLGVSAPRRLGGACIRNRLRRRIRDLFRRQAELRRRSVDLVVNLRPEAAAAGFAEMREDFERAWRKACRRVGAR